MGTFQECYCVGCHRRMQINLILEFETTHIIAMISPLYFQIPIFFLLIVAARQDYLTRTVSNDLIAYIAIFSIPLILNQTKFFNSHATFVFLFLGMFYFRIRLKKLIQNYFANPIGGGRHQKYLYPSS